MGVNQRAQIKMTDAEIDEFLHERRTMSMATIGKDGGIELVAMWYGFLDGDIAFETKAKSQKVVNLRRDDRLTVMVEDGEKYEELRGVTLVGRGEIVEDQEALRKLGISVFERYYGPFTDEVAPFLENMLRKRVVVRLRADKVISWDHRKLNAS